MPAAASRAVGVRRYHELFAWQLADAFKQEVFALARRSPAASADVRYRAQLLDAAGAVSKDIAEGFVRCSRREFARFLGYALGSLVEAETRLRDGVELQYFTDNECRNAFRLARRCFGATLRLKQSQFRPQTKQG
jgi:four helix bundle protein